MDEANPQLPRLAPITAREREVLHWVAEGKSNGDIGRILGCSERTVKKHLEHIFPKLGVETRTAAAIAYLQGMSRTVAP
jgi:DNA-binding CsgD family transcriptional regulator